MKVLFIGGTGNISTSVSRLCIDLGIDLYLLNRGLANNSIDKVKNITGDITKPETLHTELRKHKWDAVVNWIAFNENDITRDYQLFKSVTKQYIFISSASCYQKPLLHPVVTESTPLSNPYWEYSRNKIACEEKLNDLYRNNNFPITIVRPSHTYSNVIPVAIGGWNDYTIIERIKKGKKIIVHGDGTSLWTLTHARDFAKGFVGLLGNPQAIGNAFHITSDEILTWNQIYKTIAECIDIEPEIVHISSELIEKLEPSLRGSLLGDKATSVIFDNSKIKRYVPGFNAVIPFNEGIKETIKWFESDPERMILKKDTNKMMDRIINFYEKLF